MNYACPESESSSDDKSFSSPSVPSTTTIFRRRRSSDPLCDPSELRCHHKRWSSSSNRANSRARSLMSVEESSCDASGVGITVPCFAPRELEMLQKITGSPGADSDTSSGGRKVPVHVPVAALAAEPSGTQPSGNQPRRPLRRSTFSKDSTTTMTKSRRRRVTFPNNNGGIPEFIALKGKTESRRRRITFNDGVIPELTALEEDNLSSRTKTRRGTPNHQDVGQRNEVVELRIELCNQKRLVADLQAQIQSLDQRNSASIPKDFDDGREPSHARDEQWQIDELKLELANERGRNAALSSRVDSLAVVEARNRALEEENEELRKTVAEIQDKMSSFQCNVAGSLAQNGKSTGTEETAQGIPKSDSGISSVCSDSIFTQKAGEMPCFEEKEARDEAEDCC